MSWPAQYRWRTHQTRQEKAPWAWNGSLIQNKRDASGQIYMRNRFDDPGTGRFTQEDPIGIAGGMNVYGFAAGDPVNYSDPYGLKVDFNGDAAAARLWNQLASLVNEAMKSDDSRVAASGRYLARMMNDMWHDEDMTYIIQINNDPAWVYDTGGGEERSLGSGRHGIQITDQDFTDMGISTPVTVLAHELGGAQSTAKGGSHDRPAVRADNHARTLLGCAHRNAGHKGDGWEFFNPTCER